MIQEDDYTALEILYKKYTYLIYKKIRVIPLNTDNTKRLSGRFCMFSIVQHLFSFYAFYRAAISSQSMPYIKDLLFLRHILLSAEQWFYHDVCLTLRICFS